MRFIHIADVHLGCRPDVSFPWGENRGEELWATFSRVVDICVKMDVELLLIAGDLFDAQPSREELKRANAILKRAARTEVVLIAGDHDYLIPGGAREEFLWADNVHFLHGESAGSVYLEKLDTTVHGIGYEAAEDDSSRLEKALPDREGGIQILLAHGGDGRHLPFDPETLARAGFDYVALGHVHTPRLLQEKRIAYAGSPEPLCKEEGGRHGYISGEITAKRRRFTFVPFSSREYVTLHVRVSSDIYEDELKEKLKAVMTKQGERNIYLLSLEGHHRPHEPYRTNGFLSLGNVVEVNDCTTPDYDMKALLDSHRDDIVGMYMEELLKKPSDQKLQRALYCGLDALLFQEEPN